MARTHGTSTIAQLVDVLPYLDVRLRLVSTLLQVLIPVWWVYSMLWFGATGKSSSDEKYLILTVTFLYLSIDFRGMQFAQEVPLHALAGARGSVL